MILRPRWLWLRSRCPKCGRTDARKVSELHIRALEAVPPDAEVDDVKCRGCGATYRIPAAAYQRAA